MRDAEHPRAVLTRADIVHDLLGVTHSILGFATMLGDGAATDRDRRAAAAIVASARRMAAIVDAAGRLDGGPVDVRAATASVSGALANACRAYARAFDARGLDLRVADLDDVSVTIDQHILELVLSLTLACVAFRSPDDGLVEVHVEARARDVRVVVAAAGRLDRDRCLALAADVASAHGARLVYEPSRGAVTVALPRAQPCDRADGARLLHVDDDPLSAALVEMALADRAGWVVTAVATVAEARAALAREVFDVVVTDQHLADGFGLDLLRSLREPAAVLVTGDVDDTVACAARELGVRVITKPVDLDDLVDAIAGAVRTRAN
jgi:CheY-like chemotaxis protein